MKNLKFLTKTCFRLLALMLCLTASVPQLTAAIVVAGDNASLFGTTWTTTANGSNEMTQYPGTNYYYLAKPSAALSGTTQYKVVDNGTWYPSSDNLSFTANGTRNLLFLYDTSNHSVSCFGATETLTVAGSQTEILGSSWGQTDANNDMSTSDCINYTLSFTDVPVTAGPYAFKVVQNHAWSQAWPNSDYNYQVGFTGTADVTFSFNVITKAVNVTVTQKSVTPTTPNYYITGDNGLGLGGFSFQQQNLRSMTYDADNDVYTYNYNVTAPGTYYFTFADGGGSDWNDFNSNHRYGPTSGDETVTLGNWATTQKGDGSYAVTVDAGQVTITLDITNMRYKVDGTAPVIVRDYYVKGDSTNIFPDGWDTALTNTLMADPDEDGIYTWTSGQFHLNMGTSYYYRIYCSDGTWHPSSGNQAFSENVPGTYTVTITYNSNTGAANATLNLVQADPTYNYTFYVLPDDSNVTPTLYLWGTNNNSYHPAGEWAGTALSDTEQLADGNTWYKYTGALYENLMNAIVNNGNGGQTTDITNLAPGTYYIRWNTHDNSYTITTTVPAMAPYYITGSNELGLGWSTMPTAMTFDATDRVYTYTCQVTQPGIYGFVLASGTCSTADDWNTFNSQYRLGPTSGNDTIVVNSDWINTQQAQGDNGSYQVFLANGTYTVIYNASTNQFKVTGRQPVFIEGSPGLGLDWSFAPLKAMTYNETTGYYTYTCQVAKEDVFHFVFADGRATGISNNDDGWSTFNYHYRIGPTGDTDIRYIVGTDDWMATQPARVEGGTPAYSYYSKLAQGQVTITLDYADGDPANMRFKIESEALASGDLYMVGGFTCDSISHYYSASDGALMKYDKAKGLYYLNHVALNTNSTFCFTTLLGSSADDWANVGTRYGNNDTDASYYLAPQDESEIGHLKVDDSKIGYQMPLSAWTDEKGEWKMYTAGIYNVVVSLDEGWVKLIKTDQFNLFPMNVYLEQNEYAMIDESVPAGTTYDASMFNGGTWPLSAYNRLMGGWNANDDSNHYSVKFMGDTTDADGTTWWHWQVSASICEVFFTNIVSGSPVPTDTLERKAGVLWVSLGEDGTFTDCTRNHFDFSATRLPSNVVVEEGHCYVYYVNTVGWQTVYFVAWDDLADHAFTDAYGNDLEDWPGHVMTCVGIDPETGYEVWEYDLGPVEDMATVEPAGVIFHDGTPNATTDAKEQTGDADYINGGVYDYLGLLDDAYTLDNLIRFAADSVRYTVSDDLMGVYYDDDAVTVIHYKDKNGNNVEEEIIGALYAKDMGRYSEPSIQPDGTYDYVYDICNTSHTAGGSQIMVKKKEYDQSNWVKLVMSPNYDGGGSEPVDKQHRPYLRKYVDKIIPGGQLHIFMTDTINPTAHVLSIGDAVEPEEVYEPNVYISGHFNDTVVFNYVHQDWQPKDIDGKNPYKGNRRTKAYVTWHYDNQGNVTYGTVKREFVDSIYYKMFYVAPKPQEIAYLTWIVYDNENEDGAYGSYDSDTYTPTSPVARQLPEDPGRFYAPMNWNRSQTIPGGWKGLSENELEDSLGGYGKLYGPYSNGYAQYGGVKVNWSLFGDSINHVIRYQNEDYAWWQIFEPGQAYKIKAIIRYARSDSLGHQNNECYAPGVGEEGDDPRVNVLNAPRREYVDNGQGGYANMYFTGDYADLPSSKFIIFPIEASPAGSNGMGLGNVTAVKEVNVQREVVSVRYYNLTGIESSKPFEGINIVVTTYSDGSRVSKKILR